MLIRVITIAVIVVGLFGCASGGSKTVTGQEVTDLLPTFQKGELRLTCDTACSGAWGYTRRRAKSLYENRLWTDLAVEVANVGHRVDLTYFYLGRAAEGLGYPNAAQTYFNLALANHYKCDSFIDNCDGIEVTSEANAGLLRLPKPATE